MSEEQKSIEEIYLDFKTAGGLTRSSELAAATSVDQIKAGFLQTVARVKSLDGDGPFHDGGRKPMREILERKSKRKDGDVPTGHDLAASIWEQHHCRVEGNLELDFFYVDREVTTNRTVVDGKAIYEAGTKISADLLLANSTVGDFTPIVGEVKVRDDQNAFYALVQALAAAAQLSSPQKRARLQTSYPDYFGEKELSQVDVYVVSYSPVQKGKSPELYEAALALANELTSTDALSEWVRKIVFLEAKMTEGALTFKQSE